MKESVQAATTETEQQKLEILRVFFDRYAQRNKDSNEASRLVTSFVEKFEIELPALKNKERIWETTVAPHFNVFQVLRIERKEMEQDRRRAASHGSGQAIASDIFLNLEFVGTEIDEQPMFEAGGFQIAEQLGHVLIGERLSRF